MIRLVEHFVRTATRNTVVTTCATSCVRSGRAPMWINDLKARFSKSSERKIEEVAPIQPIVPEAEEPEPIPVVAVEPLTDPSQVKVPSVWQGIGLEQAIYEANLAGSLAFKEFDKVMVQTTTMFTC